MIKSFIDEEAERLFNSEQPRRLPNTIVSAAKRKLAQLDAAVLITDLRNPGNRLERLKGDRAHQHSIRVNDRYRLCFTWKERDVDGGEQVSHEPEDRPKPGDAYDVEITDYH